MLAQWLGTFPVPCLGHEVVLLVVDRVILVSSFRLVVSSCPPVGPSGLAVWSCRLVVVL